MPPYKCPDCGIWWAGLEHRCQEPITTTGANIVIRPWAPFDIGSASTTPMHYCEACIGWHGPLCPSPNISGPIA